MPAPSFATLLLLPLLACGPKAPPVAAAPPAPPPPPPPPPARLAGVDSEGMRVEWQVEGDRLRVRFRAPTTGWMRIGFNTVAAQHQADMVVAWVDDAGQLHTQDRYAVDPPFIEPDVDHGGTDDVVGISGTETAGVTTVEFTRPLAAAHETDVAVTPGTPIFLVLSYAESDDLDEPSVVRSVVEITP